jgi:trans-aconitate methyltransferase
VSRPGWDAEAYDTSFSVITRLGEGVLELLAPEPGERVVDLGCGTGDLTAWIALAGAQVVGIDADPAMLARAGLRHPGLDFRSADGHTLSAADLPWARPADAVFSSAALHWMTRPREVALAVYGVLRPGGRFVAEMGAAANVATVEEATRRARKDLGLDPDVVTPWYFPTPAGHAALLEDAGFEVDMLHRFARPTPLGGAPDALTDWLRVFGSTLVADLSADQLAAVGERVAAATETRLWRDGQWWADYVRLRFAAHRPEAA